MSGNEDRPWTDAGVPAYPMRWPLRCPSCGRRQTIELPYGEKAGRTGAGACPVGHAFSFRYDGVTVVVCGSAPPLRRLRSA